MKTKGLDTNRYGPLAAIDRQCDILIDLIDPIVEWYPEIEARLRRLNAAVVWEMRRLEWEVRFAEPVRADERRAAQAARRKAARGRLRLPGGEPLGAFAP